MANNKRKLTSNEDANPQKRSGPKGGRSARQQSEAIDVEDAPAQQSQNRRQALPKKMLRPSSSKPAQQANAAREDAENEHESQAPSGKPKPRIRFTMTGSFVKREDFDAEKFPVFQEGDVLIILDDNHRYLLNTSQLKHAGTFFKDDAKTTIDEPCKNMKVYGQMLNVGAMRRYVMELGEDGYYLKRTLVIKVAPKPPVVVEMKDDNSAQGSLQDDATQLPQSQKYNAVAAILESAAAPHDQALNLQARADLAPAASSATTSTAASSLQASALAVASQPTPVPDPADSAVAGSHGHSENDAVPEEKMVPIKLEDGTIVKEELAAESLDPSAASSSPPSLRNQAGSDLDTLQHLNGRPTIVIGEETYYISVLSDTGDPQQPQSKNTINFGRVQYRVEAVNPAPPVVVSGDQAEDELNPDEIAPIPEADPCPPLSRSDYVFGFSAFFQLVYSRPAGISSTDINVALRQCEALLAAAKFLNGLHVVEAHIGHAITMVFGKVVYTSILENPNRWLRFAVDLRHVAIFDEALVHVVGRYPDYIQETTFSLLNPATADLVKRKADWLRRQMLEVNELLFAASLEVGPNAGGLTRVKLDRENTLSFDTWFMVQLWRDWYSGLLAQARAVRTPENLGKDFGDPRFQDSMTSMGGLFRLLDCAGDAYLPKNEVMKLLDRYKMKQPKTVYEGMTGFLYFLDWENNLKHMKDFAKEAVQQLVVNHSILAPNEHGIHYLTCVKATEEERPWNKE